MKFVLKKKLYFDTIILEVILIFMSIDSTA